MKCIKLEKLRVLVVFSVIVLTAGIASGAYEVKINFQPSTSEVPEGYLVDFGEVFGDRGNGQSYGWNMPNYTGYDCNAHPDQRYDTHIRMRNWANLAWEIALPNGEYDVFLVCGDPGQTNHSNIVAVEGNVLIDDSTNFDEYNTTVTVSDGRLTIKPLYDAGAYKAKVCFVHITYPWNMPPDVTAGDYEPVAWRGEPVTVHLNASIYDDDPCGYGILNIGWSKVNGPGSVEFSPGNDIEDPCAIFSLPGVYELLLQAWDEVPQEGNDMAIIVVKEALQGDVDGDWKVHWDDLRILVGQWLEEGCSKGDWCDIADLNHSGKVNFTDFTLLGQHWSEMVIAEFEAWERLKNLEIPGIDVDQRFNITGDTRYVSPTGSDSNTGTIDSPWRTLSMAASSMAANRVIYLRAGTYYGPVTITVDGTSSEPAALRGYPGEQVIVRYPQSFIDDNQTIDHYTSLIQIKAPYVEVSNLHLIGARDQLPQSHFSENGIWFRNEGVDGRVLCNEIENIGHCGVKGGHHSLIEGNYIHDVGHGSLDHGIYHANDDAIIRKNLITNSTGWGVHAYPSPARLEITHNIFSGHAQDGIVIGGPDSRVLHNIFYLNTAGGVFFFRGGCQNNIVKNNIFDEPSGAFRYDNRGSNDPDKHPQNNLADYNCLSFRTPRGWMSPYDTYGLNNFTADPRWVDPHNLDFRLTSVSPCIDAVQNVGFGSNCGPF